MKSFLTKIWFPMAVAATAVASSIDLNDHIHRVETRPGVPIECIVDSPVGLQDTVIYPLGGYKLRWTEEDFKMDAVQLDSLGLDFTVEDVDSASLITARDTMKVPDSLRLTDPFRYKYYVALVDSLTHRIVVDSLKEVGDSIIWPKIDSIYYADSARVAKEKFDKWFNSLSKKEKKRYLEEQRLPILRRQMDSIANAKDSIANIKDSILKSTPRILETGFLPDSMYYKRIITWERDRQFQDLFVHVPDTGYNYWFHDAPYLRKDVNATHLGVMGSPVQYYNFFLRGSDDSTPYFEALESWTYTPETLPFLNTKTPYTELSYFGTLLAGDKKESDNLHLLTSTNITPALNVTVCYNGFGGNGILANEKTTNGNWLLHANYMGKNYMAHVGMIRDKVTRGENGGIVDNYWVRDTTIDARTIAVAMTDSKSITKKNTFFIDQQYRLPFEVVEEFLDEAKERRDYKKWENGIVKNLKDSLNRREEPITKKDIELYVAYRLAKKEGRLTSEISDAFFERNHHEEVPMNPGYGEGEGSLGEGEGRQGDGEGDTASGGDSPSASPSMSPGDAVAPSPAAAAPASGAGAPTPGAGAPKDTSSVKLNPDANSSAFYIGHSSDLTIYTRKYTDKVDKRNQAADALFNGVYNYNTAMSADSLRTMKLDNKVFVRLQPWSGDALISKLDVGVGDRIKNFYSLDPTFLSGGLNTTWNSFYVYAGTNGQIGENSHWKAKGDYVLLGSEFSDLNLSAEANFKFYPFRRARKSPISLTASFETHLNEPDYYEQHMMTNHYKWDNDFSKKSTTKIQGKVDIPRFGFSAYAGYALLANNVYYDTLGIVRQNTSPMSVLSLGLKKNFVLGKLHLDHNLLFQLSSNEEVLPLPTMAANARYYMQLPISNGVMHMQLGVDGYWNTAWYSPAWNPALGVFHNQKEYKYNNGPYFDAFVNIQWKTCVLFIKYQNAGLGWPMKKKDYFCAHHYIYTDREVKVGVYWPFYNQPAKNVGSAASAANRGHSHAH